MASFLARALALLAVGASAAGCGLVYDFGPPDPDASHTGMDAGQGGLDAAPPDDGATGDAIVFADAITLDAMPPDDAATNDANLTGCTTASDCAAGEICVRDCIPGDPGRCHSMTEPCADVEVCGCDGVVYDSVCSAHLAGVESAADPALCFGCAAGGTPCAAGQRCLGCPGAPPVCMARPDPPCTDLSVCGCDGQTYASNCDAEAAGVATYTPGACVGTCATSADCHFTEYCQRVDCGDAIGVCAALTAGTGTACGCSGRRYRSAREALRREGSLGSCDHCLLPPTSGCCRDANDCAATEACVGASADCTGEGRCEPLQGLLDGMCWSDEDCAVGTRCHGASVCPCGATCFVPDMPGTCGP